MEDDRVMPARWWMVIPFAVLTIAASVPWQTTMAPLMEQCYEDASLVLYIKAGYAAGYYLIGGLVSGPLGSLSDRVGRKPVLLLCGVFLVLPYAAVLVAVQTYGPEIGDCSAVSDTDGSSGRGGKNHTLLVFFVAYVLSGVGAGWFGVASAYISDLVHDEGEKKTTFGIFYAAQVAGLIAGACGGFAFLVEA